MIDIHRLRENPEELKKKWAERGLDVDADDILAKDKEWRETITKEDELKAVKNKVSKQIPLKKKNGEDASEDIAEMKKVGEEIKELNESSCVA